MNIYIFVLNSLHKMRYGCTIFVIIACCLAGPSTWRSCQVKLRLMPEEEGAGTGRLVALALVAGVVAFATFAIFSLVSSSIAKGGEL